MNLLYSITVLQLTIQLEESVAASLQGNSPATPEAEALRAALSASGLRLLPTHPGIQDPELARYFTLGVRDRTAAQEAIEVLRRTGSVSAAYVKPAGSPPSGR